MKQLSHFLLLIKHFGMNANNLTTRKRRFHIESDKCEHGAQLSCGLAAAVAVGHVSLFFFFFFRGTGGADQSKRARRFTLNLFRFGEKIRKKKRVLKSPAIEICMSASPLEFCPA